MNRLKTFLRIFLAFCGVTVLVGGIWFLGDPGTYLAILFGIATLFWVITWDQVRLVAATSIAALLSPIAACAISVLAFDPAEFDVSLLRIAIFLISAFGCYIWVRGKLL
jgi:hypothetical protein